MERKCCDGSAKRVNTDRTSNNDAMTKAVMDSISEGTILQRIAESGFQEETEDQDALVCALAHIHNTSAIDIVALFRSEQLDQVGSFVFFTLQHVFCSTLPLIDAELPSVVATVRVLVAKAGADGAAFLPNMAFREWCKKSSARAAAGLELIKRDPGLYTDVSAFILEAGAAHDRELYVREAMNIAEDEREEISYAALTAIGRIDLSQHNELQTEVFELIEKKIGERGSDGRVACALTTSLAHLERAPDQLRSRLVRLVESACRRAGDHTRYALAQGLLYQRKALGDEAVDLILSTLTLTSNTEGGTINAIDTALSQWDFTGDGARVFEFLKNLLSKTEDAIEIEDLNSFLSSIQRGAPPPVAWYVASLLLTGEHRLCLAANTMAENVESIDAFDLDLSSFELDDAWRLFLCRKALGYLTLKPRAIAGILIASLRDAGSDARRTIVDLMFNPLLQNFPGLSEPLECIGSNSADTAQPFVQEAIDRLSAYLRDLKSVGSIPEFRPTENERHLIHQRQADFSRDVRRLAEEKSVLMSLVHRSVLLYGTSSICHVHTSDDAEPRRVEIPLTSHIHTIELPRLDTIDPVGFSYRTFGFRCEPTPS